jgi:hypothetical protein
MSPKRSAALGSRNSGEREGDHRKEAFARWYVTASARQGIARPPFQDAPDSPGSLAAVQAARESELEPIDLTLSTEESVARQETDARALLERAGQEPDPGAVLLSAWAPT